MKKIIGLIIALSVMAYPLCGMELVRQKNAATYIMIPIVDADGDPVAAAAGLDTEIDAWSDGTGPNGFADCTNEMTEIATSAGIYYLSLTSTEMNNDYIYIKTTSTTAGVKTQHILIRTMVGDPLNLATSDDGGAINVTAGAVDSVTTAGSVTGAVGSVTGNVGGNVTGSVGSVSSGVTVSTNNDKSGYGLADDTITSAKFDETTAYPLASADTGSTAVARTGADGDTLETLSDQVDLQATAVAQTTAQNDLDTLTGADGVTLATSQPNYAPNTVVPDAAGTAPTAEEIRTEMEGAGHTLAQILEDSGTTIPGLIAAAQADLDDPDQYKASGFSTHSAADVWSAAGRELSTPNNYKADVSGLALEANVQGHVASALTTYDSPTFTEMANAFTEIKGATWSATDTLEAIRDRGDSAWITATGFATSGALATAQNDLDILTGTDGATLATSQPNYAPNTVIPDAAGTAATPAEVATALTDIHLDHLFAADYDPASKPGVATALLNEIIESDSGVSRFTQNALEQAPSGSGGGDATAANQATIINHLTGIKGATWDSGTDSLEAIRDRGDNAWLTGAGGSAPTVEQIRAEIDSNSTQLAAIAADLNNPDQYKATGFSTHSAADIWTAADRELSTPNNYKADISGVAQASVCTETRLARLDASVSSRSSHDDPDPSGYIDAAISSRSSHTQGDVKTALEAAGSHLALILGYASDLYTNQANWLTADLTTLEARLTAARAGYLDKLNVTGTLAHSDAADTYKAIGFSTFNPASDYVMSDLYRIKGSDISGTGSQLAGGMGYFFDVATPVKTINDCGVAGSGLSAADVWSYSDGSGRTLSTPDDYKATGFSTLTAGNVWDEVLEDAITARQMMRLFSGMLAGAIDVDGTTMYIKSLDGSVNRITFTSGTGGDRNVSERDVTD